MILARGHQATAPDRSFPSVPVTETYRKRGKVYCEENNVCWEAKTRSVNHTSPVRSLSNAEARRCLQRLVWSAKWQHYLERACPAVVVLDNLLLDFIIFFGRLIAALPFKSEQMGNF
jgi:hypothetical protein